MTGMMGALAAASSTVTVEKVIWPNAIVRSALSDPWVGFGAFCLLLFAAFGIALWVRAKRHVPLMTALEHRLAALDGVRQATSRHAAQQRFLADFDVINDAMNDGDRSSGLPHAWAEFSETILDKSRQAVLLEASTRPDGYFLHLGDDTKVLGWWANLFVALGLSITFLGIIAALTGAVEGMQNQSGDMTSPLINLLVITSGKFWSSIGGVVGSIILKACDRRWHKQSLKKLEDLCECIEAGTDYVPPQRLAVLQLRELVEQRQAMSQFSTQLAAAIGDALHQQISPVVEGLSTIQASLDDFKSGSFDAIGQEFGKALKDQAGQEMAQLASALTQMTQGIAGVNDKLEGASRDASDQIAQAAREFSAASQAMTTSFGFLGDKIEAMGRDLAQQAEGNEQRRTERLREEANTYQGIADQQRTVMSQATESLVEAVEKAIGGAMAQQNAALGTALEGFNTASSGIRGAFDDLKDQIVAMGEAMAAKGRETADSNAEVLARAARALEESLSKAQANMNTFLTESIGRSASAAQEALEQAFSRFAEEFQAAAGPLVQALSSSGLRIDSAGQAFERSGQAAGDFANRITQAGQEALQIGQILGRSATDLASAAGPVREATRTIGEALTTTQAVVARTSDVLQTQQNLMASTTTALETTARSASEAWTSYRERFEAVDTALARALGQIASTSAQHAGALNEQVGRVDKGLADAVDRLGTVLDVVADLASALEDARR